MNNPNRNRLAAASVICAGLIAFSVSATAQTDRLRLKGSDRKGTRIESAERIDPSRLRAPANPVVSGQYAPCACRGTVPQIFSNAFSRAREQSAEVQLANLSCTVSLGARFARVATARDVTIRLSFTQPDLARIESLRARVGSFVLQNKPFDDSVWRLGEPRSDCRNQLRLSGSSRGRLSGCLVINAAGGINGAQMPVDIFGDFDARRKPLMSFELRGRGSPEELLGVSLR